MPLQASTSGTMWWNVLVGHWYYTQKKYLLGHALREKVDHWDFGINRHCRHQETGTAIGETTLRNDPRWATPTKNLTTTERSDQVWCARWNGCGAFGQCSSPSSSPSRASSGHLGFGERPLGPRSPEALRYSPLGPRAQQVELVVFMDLFCIFGGELRFQWLQDLKLHKLQSMWWNHMKSMKRLQANSLKPWTVPFSCRQLLGKVG